MENVKNIAVELRKCQREKYHHLLQRVGSLEESGENAFFYRGNVGFLLRVETLSAIISGHKILPDRIISADFKGTQAKLKRRARCFSTMRCVLQWLLTFPAEIRILEKNCKESA